MFYFFSFTFWSCVIYIKSEMFCQHQIIPLKLLQWRCWNDALSWNIQLCQQTNTLYFKTYYSIKGVKHHGNYPDVVPLPHTAPHGECNRVQRSAKANLQQGETETLSEILAGLTHQAVGAPETTAAWHKKTIIRPAAKTYVPTEFIFNIRTLAISRVYIYISVAHTYRCPCLHSSHTLHCSTGSTWHYQWPPPSPVGHLQLCELSWPF